jgi:3-oxoacyl-[acyl-carrier protein] reductase
MLEQNVALVTGASRGIGRAIATRLHREGMNVAVVARSPGPLEALGDELRAGSGVGGVLAFSADVTEPDSVSEAVAAVEGEFGRIDLLVNNAGMAEAGDRTLWEADVEEWWRTIATNVRGPMLFARAVLPGMVARDSGRIININSSRSVRSVPTRTAYAVSKAGLAQITKSLAAALAGTGVRVFDYSPGRVKTDLTQQSMGYAVSAPDSSWTPIETTVEGLIAIAQGRLDGLTGRFIHAHDDMQRLSEEADAVVQRGGRTLVISEAYDGDLITQRTVGR